MNNDEDKIKKFESIINNFNRFVEASILKFNVQKNGIDPDDISQEVKIKIWKIFEDEKKIKNYASYIKKVIFSSVIDHLRKSKREKVTLTHEKYKLISELKSNYSKDILADKNLRDFIHQSVDTLIESRRIVVKLYLLNMTIEEIASFLNWSKDKTRNLLYRGLADLKKKLKEQNIEYEIKT